MKTLLYILLTWFFLSTAPVTADEQMHALDGNSYVVEVLKTGDQLFTNENLEFGDGKFETTFMEEKSYGKADYVTNLKDGSISWRAVLHNKDGDSLVWEGTQREGSIQGTITQTSGKNLGSTWSFKSAQKE